MRVAINGVFRKSEYNGKFGAFNNMKRIMISQYKD